MNRRSVLAFPAAAVLAAGPASAQPAGMSTVGVLVLDSSPPEPFLQVLRDGPGEIGYAGRAIPESILLRADQVIE